METNPKRVRCRTDARPLAGISPVGARGERGNRPAICSRARHAFCRRRASCKYDAWNRLVEVRDPGLPSGKQIVADYLYDAFGRRTLKRLFANGQWAESRHYIYSTGWQLLQEWRSTPSDPEPKVDVHYAWGLRGPDELVQRMRVVGGSNEVLTPLQDEWYNTALLVDQTGQVKERYWYDAYGRCHVLAPDGTPRAASAHDWNILFGGYYYDKETGLYHVRRRMLHPTLGVWLQPDPQGYADGPNLYLYGHGSPVTFVDPSGQLIPLLAAILYAAFEAAAVGAAVGATVGGIAYGGRLYITGEEASLSGFGMAVGMGALTGAVGGATFGAGTALSVGVFGTSLAATSTTTLIASAASGASAGIVQAMVLGEDIRQGALEGAAWGAAFGILGAGWQLFRGATSGATSGTQQRLWTYSPEPNFNGNTFNASAAGRAWATAHAPGEWAFKSGLRNTLTRLWRTGRYKPFRSAKEITGPARDLFIPVRAIGPARGWKYFGGQYFARQPGNINLETGTMIRATMGQRLRYSLLDVVPYYLTDSLADAAFIGYSAYELKSLISTGMSQIFDD